MTIEQAIQKAIEGGWEYNIPIYWRRRNIAVENGYDDFPLSSIFDDPLFWQSLGKDMGWESGDGIYGVCSITRKKCKLNPVFLADCLCHKEATVRWDTEWHRFIDTLAEGGTAESFFKDL